MPLPAFTAKDWQNLPARTTKISAEALEDMEARLSQFAHDLAVEALSEAHDDAVVEATKKSLEIFDVRKSYAAAADGITNDKVASQNAIDAAIAAGGGIVHFSRNPTMALTVYRITTSTSTGGIGAGLFIDGDNVHIRSDPGVQIFFDGPNDMCGFFMTGMTKKPGVTRTTASSTGNTWQDQPRVKLNPITKGSRTATLRDPVGDAGKVAAGDLVILRTGQCISNPNTPTRNTEPNSEYLYVRAVASPTITFARGVKKEYRFEYQDRIGQRSKYDPIVDTSFKARALTAAPATKNFSGTDYTNLPVNTRFGASLGDTIAIGDSTTGNWETATITRDPDIGSREVQVGLGTLVNVHAAGESVAQRWFTSAAAINDSTIQLNTNTLLQPGDVLHLGGETGGLDVEILTVNADGTHVTLTQGVTQTFGVHDPIYIRNQLGVVVMTNLTARNISFSRLNLKKRGWTTLANTGRAMFCPRGGVENLVIDHCVVDTDNHFMDSSQGLNYRIHDNIVTIQKAPSGNQKAWCMMGDVAGTEIWYYNNYYNVQERLGVTHIHEGAIFRSKGNIIHCPDGIASDASQIDAYGRGGDSICENDIYYGASTSSAVVVDDSFEPGTLTVEESVKIKSTATLQATVWSPCRIVPSMIPNNKPINLKVAPQEGVAVKCLAAWVTYTSPTAILGELPSKIAIQQIIMRVDTTPNGGGAPTVSIGIDSNNTLIAAATAVTSGGDKSATPTYRASGAGGTIKAYLAGLGTPTQGKILVMVFYVPVQERPA